MFFVFTHRQPGVPNQQWDKPSGCQPVRRFLPACESRAHQQHRLWFSTHRREHAQRWGPGKVRAGPPSRLRPLRADLG